MRLLWLVCVLGCSKGGDWNKAREVYCDAVAVHHRLVDGRFGETLAVANAVPEPFVGETATVTIKRFTTCEAIVAQLEGTRVAMESFEAGARGIVEGRPGDSLTEAGFADLDARFDPIMARRPILNACSRGDRAETEKRVSELRDTSLERIQQSIDACKRVR